MLSAVIENQTTFLPRRTAQSEVYATTLLVSQGFYRVETRCLPGGPDSKNQTHCRRHYQSGNHCPHRNRSRERRKYETYYLNGTDRKDHAEQTSQSGQGHCFEEKLIGDVPPSRADCLSHANLV